MADEHEVTRDVAYLEPIADPLIVFFWARLDEVERIAGSAKRGPWQADGSSVIAGHPTDEVVDFAWDDSAEHIALHDPRAVLDDVAAKKAILDDYERRCRDTANPAREMECQLIRDVIKHLATVYAGHPDYREDFRP